MLDKLHPSIRGPIYLFSFVLVASIAAVAISDAYKEDAFDQPVVRKKGHAYLEKQD